MRRRPDDERSHRPRIDEDLPELGTRPLERLVVARGGLPGRGRVEALIAAAAIVFVIGAGLVLARTRPDGSSLPAATEASIATSATPAPTSLPLVAGPTPEVTPAFACYWRPDQRPPVAILVGVDGFGVTGRRTFSGWPGDVTSDPSTPDPVLTGTPVDTPLEIDLITGRCALAWEISVAGAVVEHHDGPLDIGRAAQNRFRFYLPSVTRPVPVRADLTFAEGVIQYAWSVEPPTRPVALVGPTSGTATAVVAEPGCLSDVTTSSGRRARAAACAGDTTPIAVNSVYAAPGDEIPFAFPGWTIVSFGARCQPTEAAPGACSLETHETIADGVRLITVPAGPSPAVRVDAILERDGQTYGGSFFFEILPA